MYSADFSSSILMKPEFSQKKKKNSQIPKFHENPSNGNKKNPA
jgi:hypothetical protein